MFGRGGRRPTAVGGASELEATPPPPVARHTQPSLRRLGMATSPPAPIYPLVQPGRLLLQQPVATRDGSAVLAGDVWLPPADPHGEGPWPVLLCRSQHGTERYLTWMQRFINETGVAVVLQDVRGRGDSGGPNPWEPYVHEADDGADTVAWVAEQSWCNGKIGMFGYSYVGFTQTLAALGGHPALQALVPVASQQDNSGHWRVDGAIHWAVCSQVLTMAGRMGPPGNKLGALALFDTQAWERTTPLISAYEVSAMFLPSPIFLCVCPKLVLANHRISHKNSEAAPVSTGRRRGDPVLHAGS
jgi:hypothetical protein